MKKFFEEFKEFIAQGNALDLAIGVVIGAAFGAIVNSLVQDIIMPPIGLLLGGVDFSNMFVQLTDRANKVATLAEAQTKGVAVIAYGKFITAILTFLIIAFVIFLLVKALNKAKAVAKEKLEKEEEAGDPETKACPFCATDIPFAATRCPHCTSILEE